MAEKKYIIDNAELMAEWNWERNTGFDPSQLTLGSNKKVWWKCSKEHEWTTTISNRSNGNRCPYCSGRYAIKGENDLQTVNPTLSKEWDYEKNNGLTPADVLPNSNKKVWWKCEKGHEWQARIYSRNTGSGCPYCSGNKVLKGENDLQTINPTLSEEWNSKKNNGLTPADVLPNSDKKAWWKCSKGHEWQAAIKDRNNGNGCPICNFERKTSFPEYAIEYYLKKYGLDVIHIYKELGYELDIYIPPNKIAIEYDGYLWHKNKVKKDLEKNQKCKTDGIKLYRIREGLSPLNDSSIDYIVQKGQRDLPQILREVLNEIIGTYVDVNLERDAIEIENLREYTEKQNSILFYNPELAKEWNYEKNGNIRPEHFAMSSGKKTWWKCQKGHEWQARIADRNSGRGCPYCSGQKVLKGENDLQTINSTLSEEWNYEKNNGLTPTDVMPNSGKKVWWKCKKGHEWQATIGSRNSGNGCPYCSGRFAVKGENDLQAINPTLAKEWNYEKNDELTPVDTTPNSHKKAWWKCNQGHEWQATISDRNRGRGCPYCSNKKVLLGYNDLATTNPEIATEWHPTKNGDLLPTMVSSGSHKKVWWKCKSGHEWQYKVSNRNNCPECERKKKQINVYDAIDLVPIGTFDDMKALCEYLGLDYKKQHGNISSVCSRKQKTLMGKYVLRHANDDEFQEN